MKYKEIITEIKNGRFAPVYFLAGEEPFFIDRISAEIEQRALREEERMLDQVILYGNEVSMIQVVDIARRFPMMATRQVVIVKEAQNIAGKDLEKLLPYLDRVQPTTILVFLYKEKPDKRKTVFKRLADSPGCIYLDSVKLYDNEVPAWISDYCAGKGYSITPRAARMLAGNLGKELPRVVDALDKLALLLPPGGKIDEQLVEEHVGISKEFNAYELLSAIIRQDHLKVHRIVNYFEANPRNNPVTRTIAPLFNYFSNLLTYHYQRRITTNQQEIARLLGISPYFLGDYTEGATRYNAMKCAGIITWIRACDMKAKGAGNATIPDGELLRELVFRIMH